MISTNLKLVWVDVHTNDAGGPGSLTSHGHSQTHGPQTPDSTGGALLHLDNTPVH